MAVNSSLEKRILTVLGHNNIHISLDSRCLGFINMNDCLTQVGVCPYRTYLSDLK